MASFLPNALLKELTATEDQYYSSGINLGILFTASREHLDREQEKLYSLYYKEYFSKMRG